MQNMILWVAHYSMYSSIQYTQNRLIDIPYFKTHYGPFHPKARQLCEWSIFCNCPTWLPLLRIVPFCSKCSYVSEMTTTFHLCSTNHKIRQMTIFSGFPLLSTSIVTVIPSKILYVFFNSSAEQNRKKID